MKTHFSAVELGAMTLPGIPGTSRGIEKMAQRSGWQYQEVAARGGRTGTRREYALASLPEAARQAVLERNLPALITQTTAPIIVQSAADLTDRQRLARDARSGVLQAIRRFQSETGCSQEAAMQTLLTLAASGRAEPIIVRSLQLARDGRGRKTDHGLPSIRTLKRWLGTPDLAPRIPQRDMAIPGWAGEFLGFYQQPQKPSVESAYRQACGVWGAERPSIHQVRRFLGKLGEVTRERGRMGPRELKNIRPFTRRDFSDLLPNDVWSADGHCFDAEVQHPFHGRPFRPEITSIIDIATRRLVGFSVSLAESSFAVLDAIRNAVETAGLCGIFYVDNGSGYANALIKDEGVGLKAALDFRVEHSLPYNSQAKGVIERLHQTLWVQAAKRLPSYIGAAMDREARLEQFKLTRKAVKQGGAMPLIPWDVFLDYCRGCVAEYNGRAHRSLKNTSPDLRWREFEAQGWEAARLSEHEAATLFRPRVVRKLARAEIRLFNNIYFARELEEFHGLMAHIAYDIHRPEKVWVYTPEGRLICEAQCNGNSRHYFPVAVVEQARQDRAKGRLKRVEAKREEILEELHGAPALAAPAAQQVVIGGRVIDREALPVTPPPAPVTPREALAARAAEIAPESQTIRRSERPAAENYDEWLLLDARVRAGEVLPESEARRYRSFPNSSQFRAEKKRRAIAC